MRSSARLLATALAFAAGAARAQECSVVVVIDHGKTVESSQLRSTHAALGRRFDAAFKLLSAAGGAPCYFRYYAVHELERPSQVVAYAKEAVSYSNGLKLSWNKVFSGWGVKPGSVWLFVRPEAAWVNLPSPPAATVRRCVATSEAAFDCDVGGALDTIEEACDWRLWAAMLQGKGSIRVTSGATPIRVAGDVECEDGPGTDRRWCQSASATFQASVDRRYPELVPEHLSGRVAAELRSIALVPLRGRDPLVRLGPAGPFIELAVAARKLVAEARPITGEALTFRWPREGPQEQIEISLRHEDGRWRYQVPPGPLPDGAAPLLVQPAHFVNVQVRDLAGGAVPGLVAATEHLYFIPAGVDEVQVRARTAPAPSGSVLGFRCKRGQACTPGDDAWVEVKLRIDESAPGCICLRRAKIGEPPGYQYSAGGQWWFVWNVPAIPVQPYPQDGCSREGAAGDRWRCSSRIAAVTGATLPMCAEEASCP